MNAGARVRHAGRVLVALFVTALISACGGGGGGGSGGAGGGPGPGDGPAPPAPLAAAEIPVTGTDEYEFGTYALVSTKRISQTVFEYTYTADISNWSEAPATLAATLSSTAANVTVVDGALAFGEVARGGTVVSTDTFTIRQDRSQPFDESKLAWQVQATALAPTTFELIDQAVAGNVISAETGLLYKVFHEFGDERLPVEYRGRDDGAREATAIQQAIDSFASLSASAQAVLQPFLLPPADPASWYALAESAAAGPPAGPTTAAVRIAAPVAASVGPVEDVPGGLKRALVSGKVYVYWNDQRYPQDAATAFRVIDAIDLAIWPKLTGLLGEPPYDNSGILDVRLVNAATMALFYQQATGGQLPPNTLGLAGPACFPNKPVVYLNRDDVADIEQTAAHEITHAILARFPLSAGCAERFWLGEATSTWAEHFVYPDHNTEQKEAPSFLDEPTLSLDTTGNHHEYGAYLWFLYATGGNVSAASNTATQRVLRTWAALASHNSLGAVNESVSDIGGLMEQWPKFALYNWNRVVRSSTISPGPPPTTRLSGGPYLFYGQWDGLRHNARESTTAVPASGQQPPKKIVLEGTTFKGYPLAHKINYLGAKYWHFDFQDDPNIRRVRVTHPYFDGSEPTAKVQVIVRLRNQAWSQAQTYDWTGYERKTLCRDIPAEDFAELVVVISDSEYTMSHVLQDDGGSGPIRSFVEVSAFGCTNWTGSVQFKAYNAGGGSIVLNESGTATGLRLRMTRSDGSFDRFTHLGYALTGGTVHWNHKGSYSFDDGDYCEGESEGEYDVSGSMIGIEWIADFGGCCGFTPPVIPAYNLFGRKFGVAGPDDYECTDAQEPFGTFSGGPTYGTHDFWLDFGQQFVSVFSPTLYDSDPFGNTLEGSSVIIEAAAPGEVDTFRKAREYTWIFQKDDAFTGEPEL